MSAPATKRRTRKPAATTTTAIVPRSPFGQHETAAGLIWRAQVASTPATVAMDWDAFDDAFASYAADEDDGREAARQQADAAHVAVNKGRDVRDRYDGSAYERHYRGELAGCGDLEPRTAAFTQPPGPGPVQTWPERSNVRVIPVTGDMPADVDERAKRWAAASSEGEPADSPAPEQGAADPQPVQDPPHEPALDQAPRTLTDDLMGEGEK